MLAQVTYNQVQPLRINYLPVPGHWVSTQIRTRMPNCFTFIIELIMPSTNIVQIDEWLSDSIHLHHKPALLEQSLLRYQPLMSEAYTHVFSLHATGPEHYSTPHVNFWSYHVVYGTTWWCVVTYTASDLINEAISYIRSHNASHKYLFLAT